MPSEKRKVNRQQQARWSGILAASASVAAAAVLVAKRRMQRANASKGERLAPSVNHLLIRSLLPFRTNDQLDQFVQMHRRYGDIVRFKIGPRTIHLISHPDYARYVLQDNNRNYVKGRGLEKTKELLGEGLLTSEAPYWRRQRRLIQPVFHRQRIATFTKTMTDVTKTLLPRWHVAAEMGTPLNVAEEMMRLTLDIVSKTLFSTALTETEFDTVSRVMRPLLHHATRRITSPFDFAENWPTPANQQQKTRIEKLNRIVYRIIGQRRLVSEQPEDLLGLLMSAQDEETGEIMDDEQVRDEVMTIFLAGHETTSNLLAFTWALLSAHVPVRRRIEHEVDDVLRGAIPTAEDVPRLIYTNLVIQEVLRLYPPAWMIERQTIEVDEIGGFHIPAQSAVLISPYVIHRHPDFWQNPEGFDPLRFTEERSEERPRYAFIPFGGGPRLCIGNHFALTEATLIIAMFTQQFRLNLVSGTSVEPEVAFTLRPKHGIWMTVHKRDVRL